MSIYVGVAIFICYSVMVGGSCFILGKLINHFTLKEILDFPNIMPAIASAIATVMSAIAAFLLYHFQKEQKNLKDKEALYFTIIQIAGLYNKLNGKYLSHDDENVFFEMISSYDRDNIFNEANEYFYNNNFSETFNASFATLITMISFLKAFTVTKEIDLLPDYCNTTKLLMICHDIILDVYEHKGYGNEKTLQIVENVLLNYNVDNPEKIQNVKRRQNLERINQTFNFVWDHFRFAYSSSLSNFYANNNCEKKNYEENEKIKNQISLRLIKNIIKKPNIDNFVKKKEFLVDDTSKIYNYMIEYYYIRWNSK